MSSPAKRRRKNDFKASEKPVHNLDYFFAKQKDKTQTASASAPNQDAVKSPHNGQADTQLSDEELARKLQEEWNREDGAHNTQEPERQETPLEGRSGGDNNEQYTLGEGSSAADMNGVVEDALQPSTVKNTLKLQSTATAEDTLASTIPFDQSPLTFEPSDYIPDLKSHWAADGGHATYALLTRCFVLVNSTQSRIKIVDTLVNLLRIIIEGDPESVLPAVGVPPSDTIHIRLHPSRFGLPRTLLRRPTPISSWVWVDQLFRKP